jgi:hypothetical protein
MKKRKLSRVLIILMNWGLSLFNVALASDSVLHSFSGGSTDGRNPYGDLITPAKQSLYLPTNSSSVQPLG